MDAQAEDRAWREPEDGESLSTYLAEARRDRGYTWDDLVRSTDLSLGTIRKIEEGRTQNPGVFTLLRLWRALDLPIEGMPRLAHPRTTHRVRARAASG